MRPHKKGGWHFANAGRTADPILIPQKAPPPKTSWWTQPVQSREEFDRLAAQRRREAGWVGASGAEVGS
jgi:hypothetical protein